MGDVTAAVAPRHLTSVERVIFEEIIDERSAEHWTPHRLQVAAILAQELRAQSDDQEAARREGSVLTNRRGNVVPNPRHAAIGKRTAMITALRRSLQIHARAIHGQVREVRRRREINLAHQAAAPIADNLLAFPRLGGRDDA